MSTVQPHEQPDSPPREEKAVKKSPFSRVYVGRGSKGQLAKFFETHQDVYQKILLFIEQGVYDYVAAEAMGITNWTWQNWLRRGEEDWKAGRKTNYVRFFLDVRTAQSRGRLIAELEARRDSVQFWLTRGPGRTRPGRPGWTETITVAGDEEMPLELNVNADNSLSQPSSIQDLARTLVVMEQLGIATRTPLLGQSVIDASTPAVAFDVEQDDGELPDADRGYAPELFSSEKPEPPSDGNGKKGQ